MITDKQRREVAERMREILRDDPHGWLDAMVAKSVFDVMGEGVAIGETVADLIDRPTCHVVRYLGVDSDGEREYEMACGSLFKRPVEEIMPYYCPWCGGWVVEKEGDDD